MEGREDDLPGSLTLTCMRETIHQFCQLFGFCVQGDQAKCLGLTQDDISVE